MNTNLNIDKLLKYIYIFIRHPFHSYFILFII